MRDPIIEAVDLGFSYGGAGGEALFSLHIPHWQVAEGERVVLHGPSGCGKSTLMSLLSGIMPAHRGRLMVGGLDLVQAGEGARRAHRIRMMGLVFQDFPLVDYLDAVENVLLPYRLNDALRLDAAARARALDLLDELGLSHRRSHRPASLSQGERQRVAIARSLVTGPRLLLADEPTAGLDPARAAQVMELLTTLCRSRGLTLVMVTHDPELLPAFDSMLDVAGFSTGTGP